MKLVVVALALFLYAGCTRVGPPSPMLNSADFPFDNLSLAGDQFLPVPDGTNHNDYYHNPAIWHPGQPYLFRFVEVQQGDLILEINHNEPIDHAFWGFELKGHVFKPRFPEFEYLANGEWKSFNILYCGPGQQTYILHSGSSYRVRLSLPAELKGRTIRVTIGTGCRLKFTSEPFGVPASVKVRTTGG